MPVQDGQGKWFDVGDIVNVPCEVTAIAGTTGNPTVTLETKYKGFNAAVDALGPIDANQVVVAD